MRNWLWFIYSVSHGNSWTSTLDAIRQQPKQAQRPHKQYSYRLSLCPFTDSIIEYKLGSYVVIISTQPVFCIWTEPDVIKKKHIVQPNISKESGVMTTNAWPFHSRKQSCRQTVIGCSLISAKHHTVHILILYRSLNYTVDTIWERTAIS